MSEFSCPVVQLKTAEGRKLAAGCICRKEFEEESRRRLLLMKNYRVKSHGLVEIDFELAEALTAVLDYTESFGQKVSEAGLNPENEVFTVSEDSSPVIAAGCTICVTPVSFPCNDMTTGGILGDPAEETESSTEETEQLKDGFSMLTLAGSPGLAADIPEAEIERALYEIRKLRDIGRMTEETLKEAAERYGIGTGLLIFDGTGKTAQGICAGFCDGNVRLCSL